MKRNLKTEIEFWQQQRFDVEGRDVTVFKSPISHGEYCIKLTLKSDIGVFGSTLSIIQSRDFYTFDQTGTDLSPASDGDTARFKLVAKEFLKEFLLNRELKICEEVSRKTSDLGLSDDNN